MESNSVNKSSSREDKRKKTSSEVVKDPQPVGSGETVHKKTHKAEKSKNSASKSLPNDASASVSGPPIATSNAPTVEAQPIQDLSDF